MMYWEWRSKRLCRANFQVVYLQPVKKWGGVLLLIQKVTHPFLYFKEND